MPSTETNDLRVEFTNGLRALADWVDEHPELELPFGVSPDDAYQFTPFTISVLSWDSVAKDLRSDVAGDFAAAVRALGGARTKDADDKNMRVTRTFGPGVRLEIWTGRDDVCEAVVVGTEQVEVERIVTPAVTERVTEERELIEWRCAPVLAGTLGVADARASLAGQR